MSKLKAQAALEFLTTYGWMLLMVGGIGAALAYYGVFDTEKYAPSQCTFGFDFSCSKHIILEDGLVRVELSNKIGEPIELLAFTCTYDSGVTNPAVIVPGNTWNAGQDQILECPTVGPGTFYPGDNGQVLVLMQYTKKTGGFTKTVEGNVVSKVV